MFEKIEIGGLVEKPNICIIKVKDIEDKPGYAGKILGFFGEKHIPIEFISESQTSTSMSSITLAVKQNYYTQAKEILKSKTKLITQNIKLDCGLTILTIYGPHFAEKSSIASQFFTVLGDKNINIHAISTSVNSITCIIQSIDVVNARAILHERFKFPE
jgi:aspartokinase